ncbi:oligosaccharide repeat unit polymerase [Mesonia maritima]|uniref:Oligosaccharide repeat unit polymerase n=1 Tax=Mesonia maritima TaxID=1793873 RepID=A0ABU1K3H9_9FLAO|nr:oligosaccharide repeat unit polymerase [Mesonia maritima]MDR6299815.1 oligosaccharide repeat unit polymerase [Mesonia maritima]
MIKPLPFLRIFISLFLLINLLGIINFSFYETRLEVKSLIYLLATGLTGILFGNLFIRFLKLPISESKGVFKSNLFLIIYYLSNFLSITLITITHILNKGIIIMQGDKRFITFSYTNLFIYTAIITTIVYSAILLQEKLRFTKRFLFFLFLQSLFVLSMGYRSPLIILIGGVVIVFLIIDNGYFNNIKKFFTPDKLLILIVAFTTMSAISYYRVSQQYDPNKFFKNIDFNNLEDKPYLKPIMPTLAVFRYDQQVILKLIEETENNHLFGKLAITNFLTILPGKQLGVRNKIGEIVDARKLPDGTPWSITPTLQGALFVDGGYIAVYIGFFIVGFFAEFLKKLMVSKKDPFTITIYSLFIINTLMLIHTGYYDLLFFILLVLIILLKFITYRINFKIHEN